MVIKKGDKMNEKYKYFGFGILIVVIFFSLIFLSFNSLWIYKWNNLIDDVIDLYSLDVELGYDLNCINKSCIYDWSFNSTNLSLSGIDCKKYGSLFFKSEEGYFIFDSNSMLNEHSSNRLGKFLKYYTIIKCDIYINYPYSEWLNKKNV